MSKPVESQINQMGGNDLFGRFTGVEPGLPGHANHAGEGLGVQVGVRDIEPVTVKVGGENPQPTTRRRRELTRTNRWLNRPRSLAR